MRKIINFMKKIYNNEKNRQIVINMISAFIIKGGALIISLFSMPAYMRYFNNQEVLGLWFTVLSVMTWILSFDLGIGNGLRNKLVGAIVSKDRNKIKQYISSAYLINGALVCVALLLVFALFPLVSWNAVFNISENIISQKTMLFAVQCVVVGILIQFFLRLISSILYALQISAIPNLLSLITSTTLLIIILFIPSLDAETNLKMLSIVYLLCVNIPLVIATIIIFKVKLRDCAPHIKYFRKELAVDVLKLGGVFFWCQIMFMIITTTNEFFITHFVGTRYVVDYQIYNKLFTLIGMLFTLALTPMWSAITKALNEKDVNWIKKAYKTMNIMVLIMAATQFAFIIFLPFIVEIWLGKNSIEINMAYALIFALYGSVFIYQSVLSTFACGLGRLKLQAVCYTAGVLSKFIIIYYGIVVYDSWIIVVFSNLIILLPYIILQPIALKKEFNTMKVEG